MLHYRSMRSRIGPNSKRQRILHVALTSLESGESASSLARDRPTRAKLHSRSFAVSSLGLLQCLCAKAALATGLNECRALVDTLVEATPGAHPAVSAIAIRAMKPSAR